MEQKEIELEEELKFNTQIETINKNLRRSQTFKEQMKPHLFLSPEAIKIVRIMTRKKKKGL